MAQTQQTQQERIRIMVGTEGGDWQERTVTRSELARAIRAKQLRPCAICNHEVQTGHYDDGLPTFHDY